MKKTGLFLIVLAFIGCSEKGEVITENEKDNSSKELSLFAKLKVKSKLATAYEFSFGEPEEAGVKMYETSYDNNGNLTDSVVYRNNKIVYHERYEYNGDQILVKRSLLDSAGNELQSSERKLNDKGDEVEFFLYNADTLYYKQRKEYNKKDELIKITEYDSQGNPKVISQYEYNDQGKILSEIQTSATGVKLAKNTYTYDKKGNKTSITTYGATGYPEGKTLLKNYIDSNATLVEKYDANDSLYAYYQYEYNDKGQETKSIIYNGIGQIIRQANSVFDEAGNKIEFEIYEGEVGFLGKDKLTYDDQNREIELIVIDDKNKQLKRRTTEYDKNGLMVKEVNYNKIDEPIYQFVYSYGYFK